MRKLLYWSICCVALLVVGVSAGCSRGGDQTEADSFSGVHIFEGRVSEGTGGNFVLVVGDMSYTLEGNNDEIKKFAGQTVEVSASIDGNTLRVMRIGPSTRPPQEG